jgi:ATP-dependent helicase/nuclease subunit B
LETSNKDKLSLPYRIEYAEFEHILKEAEFIAKYCKHEIEKNSAIKIAIIINNLEIKKYFSRALSRYQINCRDTMGHSILEHNVIILLLQISYFLFEPDEIIEHFLGIVSHPYVNCSEAQIVKQAVIDHAKYSTNITELVDKITPHLGEKEQIWLHLIVNLISDAKLESNSFSILLKHSIRILESLVPQIWGYDQNSNISSVLREILELQWSRQIEPHRFPEILKSLIQDVNVPLAYSDSQIFIIQLTQAIFIDFDLVFIPDLNNSSYSVKASGNRFLSLQMESDLGIYHSVSQIGIMIYHFYLLLNNRHVILTRSKKHVGQKLNDKSDLILRLEQIFSLHNISINMNRSEEISIGNEVALDNLAEQANKVILPYFPDRISVSDLELLIRNPYNFYAKKILHLKMINDLSTDLKLAHFGQLFHNIVDEYNKKYCNRSYSEMQEIIEYLIDTNMEFLEYPGYIKNTWKVKLSATLKEFITLDQQARDQGATIYSEIKGEVNLLVGEKTITITAIADRIELYPDGKIKIIDYKTGSIPTMKEINTGLSPQMIIESLIISDGKFRGIDIIQTEDMQIEYIKISSSKPYINITNIKLSKEELELHKSGTINLLSHYINNMEITNIESPLAVKYDHYKNLARRK